MATQAPSTDAGASPTGRGPTSSTGSGSGSVVAPAAGSTGRARPLWLAVLTVVLALVALGCAAALPFAPVDRDVPVVTWPQSPTAPVSTSLMLVSSAPASMRVETTCAAARAAGQRGDGLLLATMSPTSFTTPQRGLLWRMDGDDLRLDVAGTTVDDSPLPAGDCTLSLVTVRVPGPPPVGAPGVGPGSPSDVAAGTGLQLQRDGVDVGDPVPGMPVTDTLATGLTSLDPAAGERLSVAMSVNDEFQSSPSPLKTVLVALLVLACASVLVCLWLLDRGDRRAGRRGVVTGRAPPRWRLTLRPRLADLATVVLAVAWTPLAPMTDDDGYYASMARDVAHSGYVGQYYQLFDQSFVPLTWPWYALSWWERVADTPLGLRIPALVLVLVTWVFVRRCADLLLGDHPRWGRSPRAASTGPTQRVLRSRAVWLLALAYAAAWTPYVMGVRPEAISALGSAMALAGVLTTVATGRRLPLALGIIAAAMAAAAHPTGAVALAPLVAGLPACWRALRSSSVRRTLVRVVVVVAPGAVATAAGFADGTWYDFVRGREVFKAVQVPDSWTDEWIRYGFLLNPGIPMGAYAKRVTVLVALLAIALALLLVALSRGRRLAESLGARALATTATTALLAFVCLWITPSKWTHHFGSLSALTPLLVVSLLLLGPDLARRALAGRGAGAVGLGVVGSVVVVAAVSMTGPDLWPYSWGLGMPRYGPSPYLSAVQLSSPVTWLVVAGLVALVLVVLARRSRRPSGTAATGPSAAPPRPRGSSLALRTAAVTTVVLLGASTTYLVGTFALAAVSTADTYSPQASRLLDPLDRRCGAAGAISVADDRRARALDVSSGEVGITPPATFVRGAAGVWQGDPPPDVPDGTAVWGSLADGNTATGSLTTPWFTTENALGGSGARALTALVSGDLTLAGGNSVVAEYGRRASDGSVTTTTAQLLDDGGSTTEWRTVRLGGPVPAATAERPLPALVPQLTDDDGEPLSYDPAVAARADVVRLRAIDGSTGDGGWLAVSSPTSAPLVTLADYLPARAVVATSWQLTYHFPCQRQVSVTDGVTDRPAYAVLWGPGALEGTGDSVWQPGRGGLYAQVPEQATLTQLESGFTDAPDVAWGQVARIDYPDAARAWDMTLVPGTTSGLAGPGLPDLAPYVADR